MCICEVLTHRTLPLRDNRIIDLICGVVTCYAVNLSEEGVNSGIEEMGNGGIEEVANSK